MTTTRPTTITCGTDFSDGARRAATVAAALAVRLGARLQLVHVIDELGAELTFAEGNQISTSRGVTLAKGAPPSFGAHMPSPSIPSLPPARRTTPG